MLYRLHYKYQRIDAIRQWLKCMCTIWKQSTRFFLIAEFMDKFIRKAKCPTQGELQNAHFSGALRAGIAVRVSVE